MESEEKQKWDKSTSEGIPVLASDSDNSIIFIAKKPLPLTQQPQVVGRAGLQVPCLPFQVQLVTLLHPLVSIDWLFLSNLVNIINIKTCCYMAQIRMIQIYILLFYIVLNRKPAQILYQKQLWVVIQMKGDMKKELWRKQLNLCELYIYI